MTDWLIGMNDWGIQVIIAVQTMRSALLDQIFLIVTFLHSDIVYIALFPLLYWAVDKKIAIRLAYVFFIGYYYLNNVLKDFFQTPRPDSSQVAVLYEETSFAFPSGHAQGATIFWGYLAMQLRRTWFWVLTIVLIAAICFSRIYLGVHYPADVIGGILIGVAVLVLALWLVPAIERVVIRWPWLQQMALGTIVPLILFALFPTDDGARAAGILFGVGIGLPLEAQTLRFSPGGTTGQRVARYVVGLIVLLAFYLIPGAVLPDAVIWRFLRYALVGFVMVWLAPWFLIKLRLLQPGGTA